MVVNTRSSRNRKDKGGGRKYSYKGKPSCVRKPAMNVRKSERLEKKAMPQLTPMLKKKEKMVESKEAESHVEVVGKKRKIRDARPFVASFKRQRIKIVPDGDEGISGGCSGRMVGELRDQSIDIYIAPDEALEKSSCSLKDSHKDIQNNGTEDGQNLTMEEHKVDIVELLELPGSQSIVNDEYVLEHVKKLRACLSKCQNAVVFYDRMQAKTIVSFLQSMTETYQPFLIVTTSSSLSQWEAEFAQMAPSVDVVVYSGNRDNREAIRASKFYGGDHLMLQVFISSAEAAFEDLNIFSSIKWKAIIIDDYQQLAMSNDLEQIKMLPVDSRMLLISGQIKDTPSEHLAVLSLLESPSGLDQLKNLKSETNDKLCRLKDRLSCFIAYGNNSHVSKFSEYWVPVEMSYLQLEQYCATLLSNYSALRSSLTKANVGGLRDIVSVARKCCDHPYLLDSSIQGRLIADKRPAAEIMDIGIKASGKLELLDMMLSEIKSRGLQVLVLFQQSISGSGVISTLSLLETFLEQRFGPDSYECVDAKLSEKQAAVSRFNKKETGQFIFLLDKRSCTSSIKLSQLDAVIIYDSEWNPANDMRALQKLSIGSEVDQIKVFRLYSSNTVEEGALLLAKQNLDLDNTLQNFSRATSDIVLSLGAVNLFSKLDKYHADEKSTSALNFSSGQLLLSKVIKEYQSILSENCEIADLDSVIVEATLGAGRYCTKVPLLGEEKLQLEDREEPHVFWRNLLDEKKYIWKHRSDGPSPRNRKRTKYFVESLNKPATERDNGVKKRQKVIDDKVGPALALAAVLKKVPSTVNACNQAELKKLEGGGSSDIAEEEKKQAAELKSYSSKPEVVLGLENLETVNSRNDKAVLVNPPAPMEVERNASEKMSDKRASPDVEVSSGGSQSTKQPSEQTPDCHKVQDKADLNLTPVELQGLDQKPSTFQIEAEAISTVIPVPSNCEAPVTDKTISSLPSNSWFLSGNKSPATERSDQGRSSPQNAPEMEPEYTPESPEYTPGLYAEPETGYPDLEPVLAPGAEWSLIREPEEEPDETQSGFSVPFQNGIGIDINIPLSHQPTSRSFHPPLSADPHQNELDNLRREAEDMNGIGIDINIPLSHQPTSGSFHPSLSADPLQNELDNLYREAEDMNGIGIDINIPLSHQPTSGSFHPSLSADPLQNELDNLYREAEDMNGIGIDINIPLSHQPTSGSFHPSLSSDPLQNELDNLCREAEDMKSQLTHDYDKEIKETIAQIHKKYELKYQEGDAEYQSKKKEVEKNHKEISKNQIFGMAFRCTLSDYVRQQVARSSSLQPRLSRRSSAFVQINNQVFVDTYTFDQIDH